jgi:hypothetical protein
MPEKTPTDVLLDWLDAIEAGIDDGREDIYALSVEAFQAASADANAAMLMFPDADDALRGEGGDVKEWIAASRAKILEAQDG